LIALTSRPSCVARTRCKVLEIAHQNSLSSSKHGLFQPHTHSHTHLLREGRKGDPPADGAGGGTARWKVNPE
jgi:hypothetical protein